MKGLIKTERAQFGVLLCDIYSNDKGEFFMTREQIGQALEYSEPRKAIEKIHQRYSQRLNRFSVVTKLGTTDGKNYDTILYCTKGVYEICRHSDKPKADEFYDHIYEILEGLRLGYLKLQAEKQSPIWQHTRAAGKVTRKNETAAIEQLVEYARSQGSRHPSRLYMVYSSLANKSAGIQSRDTADVMQLNVLNLVESIIQRTIQTGMAQSKGYKDIYQMCKNRMDEFRTVAYLQVS